MRTRKSIADIKDMRLLKVKFGRMVGSKDSFGCMAWNGALHYYGYGQFSFEGRTWSSHRLAFEIEKGVIPQDATKWWVLHTCDNPSCCNPDHLYLGDAKDNASDMIDRKRQRMGFKRYGFGENIRFGRVFYMIGGEIKTLFEWAEHFKVNHSTLEQRISAGWPEYDLGLSSRVYKRHLKSDGITEYRRFSGIEEVEMFKNKTPVAATTEVSKSTIREGNIDMSSIAIIEAVNSSAVQFHGQQIITVMDAGVAYVAMKPIVENLGMSWSTQLRKLLSQSGKYGYVHMNIPSNGGIQEMLCLPLKKLNGWLFSINPEKVRADIRDKLIKYQEECFSVLHDYWTKGQVTNPRKVKKITAGKITADQQEAIKQLVMNRGKALPKEKQAKAIITMWSSLKSHFGCTYKEINDDQFTEALSVAARVPLEGEFLGRQEALPAPTLNVNLPIQWWIDNNPVVRIGNLSFGKSFGAPKLDVTVAMLCGDNTTSSAIHLINILEGAGFDVSAPKAEIVAMRKHLANVEYGMKAIADACKRAGNKTISFRGKRADYVID